MTVAPVWTAAAAALIAVVGAEIVLTRRGTFTVRQAAQWIPVYVSLAALCLPLWAWASHQPASAGTQMDKSPNWPINHRIHLGPYPFVIVP